jgi:hypothetical protein
MRSLTSEQKEFLKELNLKEFKQDCVTDLFLGDPSCYCVGLNTYIKTGK